MHVVSNDGVVAKQRGITFKTCPAQGHNAHGRIEARIKMLQEALERSDVKGIKLHSLGWQTFSKVVEQQVNSIPLGFLYHEEDSAPLLRILTPNFLKLNAAANRAPRDLFLLPETGPDLISRLEKAYELFFRIWNEDYVPLIAKRQKWHQETEDIGPQDIVYFKLRDTMVSSRWLIGKVEEVIRSKDGIVRKLMIGYKYDTEQGERKFRLVERPIRECVRLLNLEDTTIFEDIEAVRNASREILGYSVVWDSQQGRSSTRRSFQTFACNSASVVDRDRICSVDLGYQINAHENDVTAASVDFGRAERELGLFEEENYIFFDTNIDEYDDNLNDNDDIYLL